MIAPPRLFIRFLDGRAGTSISVGFLPGQLGGYLGTLQTEIRLERTYALKLLKRRISYEGFSEIQATIDNGVCMIEDPFHLSFLFVKDKIKPEIYFLLIKTDRHRRELWLVTFHRIKRKQYPQRLKPLRVIREPMEEDFMG